MTSSSPSVLRGSARSRQLDQALLPDDDGVVERMTVVVHDGEQFCPGVLWSDADVMPSSVAPATEPAFLSRPFQSPQHRST